MSKRFSTFEEAAAAVETGEIVTYNSNAIVPYIVVPMPQVGEEASMYFNGDAYPVGRIESISASGAKITTTTGEVFQRSRKVDTDSEGRTFKRASWYQQGGGPFGLVQGRRDERNPEF